MGKFTIENGVLIKYVGSDEEVVVPENVTVIGESAFSANKKLRSVALPSGIKKICRNAFMFCESLESINLPDKIRSIEPFAFSYCKALKQIALPDNLQTISEGLFEFCEQLSIIKMPRKLKRISRWAFWRCKIEQIHIYSVSDWCKVAMDFRDNFDWNLTVLPRKLVLPKLYIDGKWVNKLIIAEDVEEIREGVFHQLDIESVRITGKTCVIGRRAFSESENLEEVIFANDVLLSIGDYAFEKCGQLRSVVWPEQVTQIGNNAFHRCKNLPPIQVCSTEKESV